MRLNAFDGRDTRQERGGDAFFSPRSLELVGSHIGRLTWRRMSGNKLVENRANLLIATSLYEIPITLLMLTSRIHMPLVTPNRA